MAAAVERVRQAILRRLTGPEGESIIACLPDAKDADRQLAQMVVAQHVARRLAGEIVAANVVTNVVRVSRPARNLSKSNETRSTVGPLDRLLQWAETLEDEFDLDDLDPDELLTAGSFGHEDAVLHFFEQFLGAADRAGRRRRGVFYTPSALAAFIVREIDGRLRRECGYPHGLADERVHVLDPAAGTGSFLVEVIRSVHETFVAQWRLEGLSPDEGRGRWQEYVPARLLPRLEGCEILPAACAVARIRLAMALRETGYERNGREEFRLSLTDSLADRRAGDVSPLVPVEKTREALNADASVCWKTRLPTRSASEGLVDPSLALRVGEGKPASPASATVILGNPPFGVGISKPNPWIDRICKPIHSPVRAERNRQPLADAYIHFLALACEVARQSRPALLGMVVNRTCFDGRLHCGLRQLLRDRFPRVSLVDLGGETRNGRLERDENVFEITQGVGIILGSPGRQSVEGATLSGTRAGKLKSLSVPLRWTAVEGTAWQWNAHASRVCHEAEYAAYPSLAELMPFRSPGVKTSCDRVAYAFTLDELEANVRRAGWRWDQRLAVRSLYRAGDVRWLYYDAARLGRPRPELARHVLGENTPSLIAMRQSVAGEFTHVALCRGLACHGVFYLGNRGQDYQFPLTVSTDGGPRPNLNAERLPETLRVPERFAAYAAAVMISAGYRTRYRELLPRDFPRLPIFADEGLVQSLVRLGTQWSTWQLCLNAADAVPDAGSADLIWKVDPRQVVCRPFPAFIEDRLWLNETSCIRGVANDDWESILGGYRVCQTFWKARRGRRVSAPDRRDFDRLIVAIRHLRRITRDASELLAGAFS